MVAEIVRVAKAEEQRLQRELEANPSYQRLQVVRRLLAVYDGRTETAPGVEGPRHEPSVRPGRQRNTTAEVLARAEQYLEAIGRRAQSTEIMQDLQAHGIEVTGQFPSRVVASILSQSDKFDNVRGQGYGLVAWALRDGDPTQAGSGQSDPDDESPDGDVVFDLAQPDGLDSRDCFIQNEDRVAPPLDARPD